jgi:competence protein ComEC
LHVPKRLAGVLLLGCVPVFIIISSASASVVRASIMSAILIMGSLLFKPVRMVNLIGLSALLILIINPLEVYDTGFQLTYLVTIAMVTLGKRIREYFPQTGDFIWMNIACSLASQIATLFHSLVLFHRFSFIALVLNIIGVPLFAILLVMSFLFIIIPVHVVRWAVSFIITVLLKSFFWLIKLCGECSWSYMTIGALNPAVVIMLMVGIIVMLYSKSLIGKASACAAIIIMLVLICLSHKPDKSMEIMMIDVGYGDSLFLKFPDGTTMLIDGGGSVFSDFDTGRNVLAPALWNQGITRIDYILLTHEHPDHIKGLVYIIREFKVKELWDSNCSQKKPICRDLLYWVHNKKIMVKPLYSGTIVQRQQARIEILHAPLHERSAVINNNSIVMKISVYHRTVLFTGDIHKEVEEKLALMMPDKLRADILKVPHHGSKTSSSSVSLDMVKARIALLSVGKNSFYGLPNAEIVKSYYDRGYELYRTDNNGQSIITIDAQGRIWIQNMALLHAESVTAVP